MVRSRYLFNQAASAARLCGILLAGFPLATSALPPGASSPSPQESPQPVERAPSPSVSIGSGAIAQTTSMEVLNDSLLLKAGDRVSFRIVEERREPIGLYITDSGEMEVPLIGRVIAAGKTCKQLAYQIKPLLEKEYFRRATVIVGLDTISPKSLGKVMVIGQIRVPGMYEVPAEETLTLAKVILRAGGLADFADKKKVKVLRAKDRDPNGPRQTTMYNLVEIMEKGHLEKDPVLKPGDLVIIPERWFNF
jgi:protein involved in polysaccharide export with SLBB domain